jgi:penicillin-binding protein 2
MVSPLEVTRIMCAVANGGLLPRLSLVRGFRDASGERLVDSPETVRVFSENTASALREMLEECVRTGTGKVAKPKYDFAGGKTASAESGQFLSDGRQVVHSWFAGFYPSSSPAFVITVIAEGGVTLDTPAAAAFAEVCDYLGEQLRG